MILRLAIPTSFGLSLVLLTACAGTPPPPEQAQAKAAVEMSTVEGTAAYRERIALPPDAVFEAVLEDVTIADAKATEIARTSIARPPSPPIHFSIAFDPAKIDARRTYSVRGRILVEGKLWFASDTAHPVLTHESGRSVEMLLKPVTDAAAPQSQSALMGGEMTYMADAARFTDCVSGVSHPLAMEADFVRMEQAYIQDVAEPGARLYVTFEGIIADRPRMEGGGSEPSLVVNRFIQAWPNQTCERSKADASLHNTYWRFVVIAGHQIKVAEGQREPQLVIKGEGERQTWSATAGCNQMSGSYAEAAANIVFVAGPMTLMACGPPLDALEKRLIDALERTKRWQIKGNTLEIMDDAGSQTALMEAVAL